MPVHNADIAAIFEEIADLLEIGGANPFRVRAYRNAARAGRIREIGGFGARTEEGILHALAERGTAPDRCKLAWPRSTRQRSRRTMY